jgi:septal ring factor EnvC (AmiA/AmiB activator)
MRLILLSFAFVLAAFNGVVAQTQSRAELEKQRAEIQEEIAEVKRSLDQTKKNRKTSLTQLALLQRKLRLRESAINNINKQIDYIQGDISKSRDEIEKLRKDLDTLKVQYQKSVVYAYKNRNSYDFLNFIFSASTFNDALKRIAYLKSYRTYREQQSRNIETTQQLLQRKIGTLELSRKEKDEVLAKQEREKQELDDEKKEQAAVISKLRSREKELNRELTSKQKADNKLRASIRAAIDREIRLAKAKAAEEEKKRKALAAAEAKTDDKSESGAAEPAKTEVAAAKKGGSVFDEAPGGELISDNFEKNKGKLPWPIDKGNIKINFGYYSIPNTKIRGTNPGLTLETEQGASVKSIFDGEVISVFDVEGQSNVIVRHGKYFTTYGNLASTTVSRGQKVKPGQVLGTAATNVDGNGEIEFLLLLETKNLDPATWIRKR